MTKICLIDNMASHYRKAIYVMMDQAFNIDWYFGLPKDGIRELNLSLLKHASHIGTKYLFHSKFYSLRGMSRLIDKYDIIIMVGEPFLLTSWSLLFKYRLFYSHKRVFLWTHGWYGRESFLKRIVKKAYFKLGTGVITYGEYAKKMMVNEGFNPTKLWAIHNSLDYYKQLKIRQSLRITNIFNSHFSNNHPVLIFIGRLTEVKRLDLIINVLVLLNKNGIYCNMVFVGDGLMRDKIERLVADAGLEKQVWMYGACYNETTNAELIYNADLCVAPGNVGLTAMHSMVYGTPVATHNNFANQMPEFEAIHEGITGTFFLKDDIHDMAYCISKWIQNHSNDRKRIRENCFKEIDMNWNPDYQIRILKQIINV